MGQAIGVRLPKEILKKIEKLSKEEMEDRSTTIRKLVIIGYKDIIKIKSFEDYKKGNITLSEAARKADLTIWEMEKYFIEQGFKSTYSIDDIEKEMKILEK